MVIWGEWKIEVVESRKLWSAQDVKMAKKKYSLANQKPLKKWDKWHINLHEINKNTLLLWGRPTCLFRITLILHHLLVSTSLLSLFHVSLFIIIGTTHYSLINYIHNLIYLPLFLFPPSSFLCSSVTLLSP